MSRVHLFVVAALLGVAAYVLVVGAAPGVATAIALAAVAGVGAGRNRHRQTA